MLEYNKNISEQELELIDNYLAGSLSEADTIAFEERMKTDEEWAAKVNEVKLLALGIQEAELSNRLDAFHKNLATNGSTQKIVKVNWTKRIAVAASLIVCVGVLSWLLVFNKTGDEQLYASFYTPDPGLPTLMGVSENYEFEKAMVDYKTGDYNTALKAWQGLLKTNPDNDTLNYFIASAHLANKETDKAVPYFDKVIAANTSVFLEEAKWYKALTLLQQGKKQEAIDLLNITEHPDKEALLRKLKP